MSEYERDVKAAIAVIQDFINITEIDEAKGIDLQEGLVYLDEIVDDMIADNEAELEK
jgi:hypothetical protein